MNATPAFGAQLQTGDTILVWWQPGRDTITSLTPYDGAYKGAPGWDGVRLAEFALYKPGMTIFPCDEFERVAISDQRPSSAIRADSGRGAERKRWKTLRH